MEAIEHFEVPHLALWKSCAAEMLAGETKQTRTTAYGIDTGHPLMKATDIYCRAMERNAPLKDPGKDSTDELAVQAYLSFLHHKMAHAKIGNDAAKEVSLQKEIAEYKFGNPLWQQMFVQYYKYYWQYPYHQGAVPKYRSWQADDAGKGSLDYGVIEWKLPANARIIIVGDIGTGTEEAANVLSAACKFKPDAILHLGDIYFSGTRRETRHRLVDMVRRVLKKENCRAPFFTVPGNHEYFTGAVSLLDALDSGKLIYKPDQAQQASYFCLRSEDDGWQFLGLDTGYNGHYMNVAKGAQKAVLEHLHIGEISKPDGASDPHWSKHFNPYFLNPAEADLPQKDTTSPVAMVTVRPDELIWHQDKLKNFTGRAVLLSHHQLYSALDVCGVAQAFLPGTETPDPKDPNRLWVNTGLWQQFGSFFGDRVGAWIWGHEHNLVIFEDNYRPADWSSDDEFMQIYKNLPKGRCAGHSAIPVQDTEEPYKVNYPVPLKEADLTLSLTKVEEQNWYNHGFQLIELAGKGNPARLSYFQVSLNDDVPLPLFVESII
ncbi:MAG TPA: metallophosphoesterase [Pyrinomonadaceae bacterium]|jgi:3',5'-cyclic AMP phosphodiesterase CpdA